jgi:Ca2+-binding EF-hand superfamily protein
MPSLQFLNDTEVEREELSGAEEEEEERELEMEGEADEEEHEEEQEMGEDIESHEIHPQNHHELHHEQEDDELEN